MADVVSAPIKRADPFYSSPEWRTLRLAALKRDHFRCSGCGASVALRGQSRVDHIKPRRQHPQLALDLDNLRTFCPACDNKRHAEKGSYRSRRVGLGADGWPLGLSRG